MAGALTVEVLDRLGRVKERLRIEHFPATIGRAYSCDVILDDRFVSPQHLRFERDQEGRLFAEDLQSTNGVQRLAPFGAIARVPVEDDLRLRLGHTVIRLRTGDHPIEPAARLITSVLPAGVLGNRFVSLGLCTAALLLFNLDDYLTYYERFSPLRVLSQSALFVLLLLTWAGVWSLVSRVLTQSFHFLEHCTVAALWALVLGGFVHFTDYYAFAFSADQSAIVLGWVGAVPLLAGLLYSHLRFCSAAPPVRLLLRSTAVSSAAVGLAGLVILGAKIEQEWPTALSFSWQLKPPVFQLAPSRGVEEFFTRAQSLKEKADRLAKDED